jgi:hypothetical protein
MVTLLMQVPLAVLMGRQELGRVCIAHQVVRRGRRKMVCDAHPTAGIGDNGREGIGL